MKEDKEWKEHLHYLIIGYSQSKTYKDGKKQWKEILDFIELEKKRSVLEYILSLGWQDTDNKYVKEVIEDADRIAKLLEEENEEKN